MKTTAILPLLLFLLLHTSVVVAQQLVIKDQKKLKTRQAQPITLELKDLKVEADKGLNYPNGFYLLIADGDNYSVNGNTITPEANFVGKLNVGVRVTNGTSTSNNFPVEIQVHANGNGGSNNDDDDDDDDGDNDDGDGDDDDDDSDVTNQRPTIINQASVDITKNQAFKIELSHLVVSDPDSNYPNDFILKVEAGSNYSVSGTTITPASNFTGVLLIKLKVNDGHSDSDVFNFRITVKEALPANVKPIITGQTTLSTFMNEPLTLKLTDLSVTDPDDSYPTAFILMVMAGENYTVSGNTVTPAQAFVGTLTIEVKVNDGTDDSNVFDLRLTVAERGTLQIVGHSPLSILEDSAYVVKLLDLKVNDPSGTYPAGYSLTISPGENYSIEGLTIRPKPNYFGPLTAPLKITKGGTSSNTFNALVTVQPVNDPPTFAVFDNTSIGSPAIANNVPIAVDVKTADVDNEKLVSVEIAIDSPMVNTELSFISSERIRGAYDINKGLLIFLGDATLSEYDRAIRSVTFSSMDSLRKDIKITFRLNDGSSYSPVYTKEISNDGAELELIIPTAFTPNNDNANDRWEISLLQLSEETKVELQIYNQKGLLVFESDALAPPWDGKFNGELLPADSYFYTLIVSDRMRRVRRSGVVTILR